MTGGALILVVEDDHALGEALCAVLDDQGYRTARAHDGLEALAYLRSGAALPQVIVLDLMMPVMDGREFRLEQTRDEALARIPTLLLTAAATLPPGELFQHVLRKPIELQELLDLLARLA